MLKNVRGTSKLAFVAASSFAFAIGGPAIAYKAVDSFYQEKGDLRHARIAAEAEERQARIATEAEERHIRLLQQQNYSKELDCKLKLLDMKSNGSPNHQ
jgi:hypothetical protein